jgi:uncharacterized OB-fold protein
VNEVFTESGGAPRLVGSRCNECATVTFPAQPSCPRCASTLVSEMVLGGRGTLWTWTIQGFRPKSPPYAGDDTPETFVPYGVGYIELDGEVRVEARLTLNDPDRLRIGMPMQLELVPFGDTVTYAFAPIEEPVA